MAQLMPLPLTVSCFSKIQIGFTFLVPAHPGSTTQRAVKRVCVCYKKIWRHLLHQAWSWHRTRSFCSSFSWSLATGIGSHAVCRGRRAAHRHRHRHECQQVRHPTQQHNTTTSIQSTEIQSQYNTVHRDAFQHCHRHTNNIKLKGTRCKCQFPLSVSS